MRNACLDGLGIATGGTSFENSPTIAASTVKAAVAAGVTAVVTTTLPAPTTAFAGTVAVIDVALFSVTVAVAPPIVTSVALVRPEPLMVTTLPAAPEAGETELIVGGGGARTVKADVAAAKPVTVTTTLPAPNAAADGTVAVIVVALLVKVAAARPMVTVAPVKFEPLMVTVVPAAPVAGDTEVIAGAASTGCWTVNAEVAERPATVTTTFPAPTPAEAGTLVLITEPLLLAMAAATPPIVTVVALIEKFVPVMVTGEFGKPAVAERLEMVGGVATVPHPTVLMLIVPTPMVTVAVGQETLLTVMVWGAVTVWAKIGLLARPTNTRDAAMRPRVRDVTFM